MDPEQRLQRNRDEFFTGDGEMAALMRATDWSQTALGAVENWPQSLKTVVRIMLTSRYAMWMGWGDSLNFFYNDAYRPTLGVKHPWALSQNADQVWAEIWSVIGPRIETVLQTGEATWDEALLLFLERSGYPEETYHTFSYSPLADDDDQNSGMLCVVTEVTERVLGERRLTLLREMAVALAAAQTPAEVYAAVQSSFQSEAHDVPFTLTYLFDQDDNSAHLAFTTGISVEHPSVVPVLTDRSAGSPWPLNKLRSETEPILIEDLANYFDDPPTGPWDKAPQQALLVALAQQGQERSAGFLVVALNPYCKLDKDYFGFVSLLAGQLAAGIANARAYEEERKRAEALAELDRAKTTFFSNISHEFRTPLTLMLGPMEDALNSDSGALVGLDLEVVHRNGLRLLKLVNALLDFSRLEAGRVQATYELTDLGAFTAELASVFRSAVEKAGMRLIVNSPSLSLPAYVDRDMWEKIVLNLLSNAFKFTAEGEIEVVLKVQAENVVLSVRDTGTGITAEQLPHIFERFHRVEGARSRTHEGTGIGLALVQELVKLHGGEITARSRAGEGSEFTVTMPTGTEHLAPERILRSGSTSSRPTAASLYTEEALRWIPEMKTSSQASDVENPAVSDVQPLEERRGRAGEALPTVLLADDNTDMREYVQRLLSTDYHVIAVADGNSLLDCALERRPDLILSDVMMPGRDGFSALQALRADPKTQTIPVILLSARAGTEARIEGLAAGADDYVTKPFSARELLARVATLLELSRVRKAAEQAVRESAERLSAALDAAGTGIFRWDVRTNAVEWDETMCRLFGLPKGVTITSLEESLAHVHPDDRAEVIARCQRSASEGTDFEMEMRVLWPDGSEHWIYDKGKTFSDEEGKPLYMTGACLDITERKQTERHVQTLNVRLQRAMTETHHRVKNNLQLMSALIDMQRGQGREMVPVSELVRLSANVRALGVIHDILTQEAKEGSEHETLSAKAVLDKLLAMLQQTVGNHRLGFEIDEVRLFGRQATSLALIANELISNAQKHGTSETYVMLRVEGGQATLQVEDDGPGFPDGFDPALASNTGLELVENMVAWDLRGKTAYTSRPEGGGRVAVTFPIAHP